MHEQLSHGVTQAPAKEERYYTALGRACDGILRCKDCSALVTGADIKAHGCCLCGNKKFNEVITLSPWEWLKIRLGLIDFPHRREFLREFPFGEFIPW